MKWLWWLLSIPILCLILNGCSEMNKDKEETGGRHDWTNPDAPKFIESKEITAFKCEFNCDSLKYYDHEIPYDYCSFSMTRQESDALCAVRGYKGYDGMLFDFEITVPLSSLDTLQGLIDGNDLAKVNGIYKKTDGLPAYLGSYLLVEYASDEQIYAYDNNWDIISSQASLCFYEFFRNLARDADCDFLHTEEEIQGFQAHIAGIWKDSDSMITLDFQDNVIKIYDGQRLVEDTTYFREYEKLYNEREESGHLGPYMLIEWRDGWIIGIEEDGTETKFCMHEKYGEE